MSLLHRIEQSSSAAALTATLLACSQADTPRYFPLGKGDHWHYQVTENNPLGTIERPMSIDDVGIRTLDKQRYYRRRTDEGTEYWLRIEDGDLLRVATRAAVEYLPKTDPASLKVMPLKPALNDHWMIATVPYILERAVPFRERFTHDEALRIEMHMRVASLDDEVTVPAGTYRNCLRIEGDARLYVLADPRIGASEVPVTQTEWYAPDVGLIKLVRREPLETTQIVGGTVSMELVEHVR